MKQARNELKVEGAVELPRVVEYLEQLVAALKAGTARVRQASEKGEREIVLGPRGVVGFALTASDKGKRQRLSLDLTWRKFNAPDAELDLHIDSAVVRDAVEVPVHPTGASEAEASVLTGAPGVIESDADPGEAHEGEPPASAG